ncbi:MAG: hypothetical protein H7X76_01260 [Prolixibacteraceae bacterium]|nr:hypothetical protein [Burkholderiales bacterium]
MDSASTVARDMPVKSGPRLDGLSEVFVHLAGHTNVNANQIFVVKGSIDVAALTRSVGKAVSAIPLLRTRAHTARGIQEQHGAAQDKLVWHRSFGAECDLSNSAFRDILMDFSNSRRIDWRVRAPIQVLLVTGLHGATSCVYVNSHHGVADARSDCLLWQILMRNYAQEMGHSGDSEAPLELPFHSLQQIRPDWYSPLAKTKRWLGAGLSVALDMLRFDRGMMVPYRQSRWECDASNPDIGRLDFFHSMVPEVVEKRLKQAARAGGVTINTVLFSALVRTLETTKGASRATMRVTCAVSLRRLIDPSYDSTFRNYLVASNIRVTAGLATKKLLAHIQRSVQDARSERRILTELGRLELLLFLLRMRPLARIALSLINRTQGTNACYSNPGVIEEDFSCFGIPEHKTIQYTGFGCVIPPYDFILYTPTVNGRMQLDITYRRACFPNIKASFIDVFNSALANILDELLADESQAQVSLPSFEMDPS